MEVRSVPPFRPSLSFTTPITKKPEQEKRRAASFIARGSFQHHTSSETTLLPEVVRISKVEKTKSFRGKEAGDNDRSRIKGNSLKIYIFLVLETDPCFPVISFAQRGKVLDLSDDDPSLIVELDPDQFVKDLKQLDPNNWDPLPYNVM